MEVIGRRSTTSVLDSSAGRMARCRDLLGGEGGAPIVAWRCRRLAAMASEEAAWGVAHGGREEDALMRLLLEKRSHGFRILFLCVIQIGECVLYLGHICWRQPKTMFKTHTHDAFCVPA